MIRWLAQIRFTRIRPLEAAATWAAKRIAEATERETEQQSKGAQ